MAAMTFTVTYRDKSGAKREEALEAASRAECVATCRARGVAPIAIRESDGRAASPRRPQSRTIGSRINADSARSCAGEALLRREDSASAEPKGRASVRASGPYHAADATGRVPPRYAVSIVLAVLVVLVGTAGLWFFLCGRDARPNQNLEKPRSSAIPREVTPKSKSTSLKSNQPFIPATKVDKTMSVPIPEVSVVNRLKFLTSLEKNVRKPTFKRHCNNYIAGILSATPGERFIDVELADDFDKDFKASLHEPIDILPDDSPVVAADKTALIEARKVIAKMSEEGATPSEVVKEARDELDMIADYRDKLRNNLELLIDNGTVQDVNDYLEEANKLLAEYHALPLSVSEDDLHEMQTRNTQKKESPENEM